MKGLYVYGALSMALSFAAGIHAGDGFVAALAVAAAISAAAAEAVVEVYRHTDWDWLFIPGNLFAFASWLLTCLAALFAILILL